MSVIDPALKIYVEQLRGGKVQHIDDALPPEFLGVKEAELSFVDPVKIKGETYLAQDELVIQLHVTTQAVVPCRVCNELFKTDIEIDKLIHLEPILGLKRGFFDISEVLREAILLEVPQIAECHGGHCPERKEMEHVIRSVSDEIAAKEDSYHPFGDLSPDDFTGHGKKKK